MDVISDINFWKERIFFLKFHWIVDGEDSKLMFDPLLYVAFERV